MLLKAADDKTRRIQLLMELQRSPVLDGRQKQWLREELSRLRKGIQGEKDSAFFLDQYWKRGTNHVVLHDLRFEVDGDVAQIDHLIFNRIVGLYLVETKNYAGNVQINAHGEFTVDYDGDRFGVPSPIEQSKRHARILLRLLERLGIKGRDGTTPKCHHVVLFHPKAIITRPKANEFDTTNVIKADQFPSWHQRFTDKGLGTIDVLRGFVNMRSLDTLEEWGEMLKRQHRPADLLALPDFMQPRPAQPLRATSKPAATPQTRPVRLTATTPSDAAPAEESAHRKPTAHSTASVGQGKRLVCLQCHCKLTYEEGKFCWNRTQRFAGGQYCREHQAAFND